MPTNALKRIVRERSKESVKDFWAQHKKFVAWCVLVVAVVFATGQSYYAAVTAQDGVDEINEEREVRLNTQSSINAFFCQENNNQDLVLGKLVAISLAGAPPESTLSQKQLEGLHTFERLERDLKTPANCHRLAIALAEATGADVEDIKITPLVGLSVRDGKVVGSDGKVVGTVKQGPADPPGVVGPPTPADPGSGSAGGGTGKHPSGSKHPSGLGPQHEQGSSTDAPPAEGSSEAPQAQSPEASTPGETKPGASVSVPGVIEVEVGACVEALGKSLPAGC